MAISARKHETEAITEILENKSFKDSATAARAILRATYDLLLQRDWFVIANRIDETGPAFLIGMYPTENEALKVLEKGALGISGETMIVRVASTTARTEYVEEIDHQRTKYGPCAWCSHPRESHAWPRHHRAGCVIKRCQCQAYKYRLD